MSGPDTGGIDPPDPAMAVHTYRLSTPGAQVDFATDSTEELDLVQVLFDPYQDPEAVGPGPQRLSVTSLTAAGTSDLVRRVLPGLSRQRLYGYEQGHVGPAVLAPFGPRRAIVRSGLPDALTLYDRASRTVVYLREAGAGVDLLHLEQLIKYAVRLGARQSGLVHLHAAGWSVDGLGTVAAGPKGAGKSTLLMAMLASGAGYVANDGVHLRRSHGAPAMVAWPHMIRLDARTIDDNPVLRALRRPGALAGLPAALRPFLGADGKVQFYHPVLDHLFGVGTPRLVTPLAHVLAPAFDAALTRCELTASPAARDRLSGAVRQQPWASWLDPQDAPVLRAPAPPVDWLPPAALYRYGPLRTEPARVLLGALAGSGRGVGDQPGRTVGG